MGFDWEGIIGAHGASLAEAYDDAVSTEVYDDSVPAEVYDEPMAEFEDYDPMPILVDEDDA